MSNKSYRPISCDFHSELELLALRRQACPIVFRHTDGEQDAVFSSIQNLYARNGEEFLLLPDGREIRLDCLISVNGLELSSYC